jgi:arsenate reductase-like glutaredoxin family protein
VTETVDATKVRYGEADALKLLHGMEKMIALKGKKLEVFDLKHNRPSDETLLAHLMGPTGNLRAPTARVGKTLLVGFNEDTYGELFGAN